MTVGIDRSLWNLKPVLVGASLLILAGYATFVGLERAADGLHAVDLELADLASAANRLDALEWRAIAQAGVRGELRESVAEHRARAEELLASLARRNRGDANQVLGLYATYRDAVDREFAALESGRIDEARIIDDSEVDPAYARLVTGIAAARGIMVLDARRLAWLARFGALLGLLIASATLGYVTWRAQQARQLEHDARREQASLRDSNARLEQANAALREASRLKGEFVANMSHELRTPLTSLLGFLELLIEDLCSSPEERQEFLQNCHSSARNLLRLINDLLDMSRLDAGTLPLTCERVGVREVFESVRRKFARQAESKGILLTFDVSEPLLAARADSQRTRQVLEQLVDNGLKFTSAGSVSVRATAAPELAQLVVEVADTGIGVPPDRLDAVFDAFTQGDGSSTRRFGGTGIGLTISRKLAERMGGTVALQSAGEGRGTRVSFTLPLWVEEPLATGPDAEAPDAPPPRLLAA